MDGNRDRSGYTSLLRSDQNELLGWVHSQTGAFWGGYLMPIAPLGRKEVYVGDGKFVGAHLTEMQARQAVEIGVRIRAKKSRDEPGDVGDSKG